MKKLRLVICFAVFALCAHSAKAISPVYDTLVPLGATWKYLDDGTSQDATNWKLSTFSDATWASGPAPLGFGDPWIITCIHSGCGSTITCTPSCSTVTITDYFRKQITLSSVTAYDSVSMDAQVDDGIVMYVNGTQVWSFNMPSPFNYTTITDSIIQGTEETVLQHITIPMTGFVTGTNQIAVELHQRGATTSDATIDVRMRFKRRASTGLSNISTENEFSVYPNPSNGNFTIESANPAFQGGAVNMSVCDLTGRMLFNEMVQFAGKTANVRLPLNPGMYIVRLADGETSNTMKINISK